MLKLYHHTDNCGACTFCRYSPVSSDHAPDFSSTQKYVFSCLKGIWTKHMGDEEKLYKSNWANFQRVLQKSRMLQGLFNLCPVKDIE